jgi:hypothetical protein
MASKRTGHTGGHRPPGGFPSETERAIFLRDPNLVAAIRATANKNHMRIEAVVAASLGVKLSQRPLPRNGSKPPPLDC